MSVTETPPESAVRAHIGQRISAALYAFERSLAVGATALMVFTYAAMVLWSNANRQYNQFDILLLKWSGHPEVAQAPDDVKASIAGFWSPLLLGLLVFGLCLLALRTRERLNEADGVTPAPRMALPKKLIVAAVLTVALWGIVLVIGHLSSLYLCLLMLVGLAAAGIVPLLRQGPSAERVMGLIGSLVGAGFMAWYFVGMGSEAYDWNLGLSGVLLLYVGFIGASMATHDGRHIRVDAIRKALKGPGYHLYNAISDFIALAFTAFLAVMAWRYLSMLQEKEFMQEAARMPQWIAALPIAVAFVTMSLRFGLRIADSLGAWRRRENAPELAPELH